VRLFVRTSIACLLFAVLPIASALAQDEESATTFLRAVYRNYGKGGPGVDFAGPQARHYFSKSLLALLHADKTAEGDEPGVLDGDPVCGCQDWDALHDLKIAIAPQAAGHLEASVSFALFGSDATTEQSLRSLTISLVRERDQWHINNILDKSDPKAPFDLRAELKNEIHPSKQRASQSPASPPTKPRF
jgi:hypothetical protein